MAIFGYGLQGQIYGYGLKPSGLIQVVAKCIPCVSITALTPAIALISGYPSTAIASAFPTLQISSLIGALVVVALFMDLDLNDIKPALEIEECECDHNVPIAPIIPTVFNSPVGTTLSAVGMNLVVRWGYPLGCVLFNPPLNLVAVSTGADTLNLSWDKPEGCV